MFANIVSGVVVSFTHSYGVAHPSRPFISLFISCSHRHRHPSFLPRSKIILAYTNPETGYPDVVKGYLVAGIVWASIFSVPPLLVGLFIQERPPMDERGAAGNTGDGDDDDALLTEPHAHTCCFKCKQVFVQVGRTFTRVFGTLRNRAYLFVTLVFFFSWTCVQFLQNVMYLHSKYVTKLQDHFQWILLILQVRTLSKLPPQQ
jgi:Na+/melibiose symporter-like transporter